MDIDDITIYASGGNSNIEVIWNSKTGAVRVLPDGGWLYPNHTPVDTIEDPFSI